ncbi:MAG: FlxA-like family protein [Lachnospiraceae bacterium]|nr:FlxA-like family protein [Lachnospiraceae bacterium]
MNVKGVNGSGTGLQSFGMNRNQGNDSVSKNLQNRIADAQKQMQELGDNKEMSLEEKMKKRQEIQQQISDLKNQLRQHQIEKSKENRQKKGSSMDDMLGGNRQAQRQAGGSKGMSNASMKALISADTSMDQVKIQGAAKGQAEGKAGVLKAEIKLDSGRGGDTRKKEEELAKIEEKVNEITQSQMNALSDINKKVDEAAKADRDAEKIEEKEKVKKKEADKAKEADNKAKAEKTGNEEAEQRENTIPVNYTPIDVVSDGITVNGTPVAEPEGKNVDLKL